MNANTKIFGIGLSKTGTMSLTRALNILGIKAKHFPEDRPTQEELRRGHYHLSFLQEMVALTDIPFAPFYPQLDRQFPDSKFILTTRPTDCWLVSMEDHFRFWVEHNRDDFTDFVLACAYGVLHYSPERMAYVKRVHEDSVRSYFADRPDRLLVLNVFEGEGWVELCGFLGCSIPDEPYPHVNLKLKGPKKPKRHRSRFERLVRRVGRMVR
jgi:hypothetical protein